MISAPSSEGTIFAVLGFSKLYPTLRTNVMSLCVWFVLDIVEMHLLFSVIGELSTWVQ